MYVPFSAKRQVHPPKPPTWLRGQYRNHYMQKWSFSLKVTIKVLCRCAASCLGDLDVSTSNIFRSAQSKLCALYNRRPKTYEENTRNVQELYNKKKARKVKHNVAKASIDTNIIQQLYILVFNFITRVEKTETEDLRYNPNFRKTSVRRKSECFVVCCITLWLNPVGLKDNG